MRRLIKWESVHGANHYNVDIKSEGSKYSSFLITDINEILTNDLPDGSYTCFIEPIFNNGINGAGFTYNFLVEQQDQVIIRIPIKYIQNYKPTLGDVIDIDAVAGYRCTNIVQTETHLAVTYSKSISESKGVD